MRHFRRLGLQKRIMLYVAVGLVAMFGALAYLGMQAIGQATELVYEERLGIAYMTARTLERDFVHVARDVLEMEPELTVTPPGSQADAVAGRLLRHLSSTDPFPFFRVSAVWLLDPGGQVIGAAPRQALDAVGDRAPLLLSGPAEPGQFALLPAATWSREGVVLATIAVPLAGASGPAQRVVAVQCLSLNSTSPYVPFSALGIDFSGVATGNQQTDWQAKYHLEVVDAGGTAVLGIGEDERPGQRSRHFSIIQPLMAARRAQVLLHTPGEGESFRPHVMAVVPLATAPLTVVLEQEQDVALALPFQLRQRLILFASVGFLGALLVAWVTTRHVVKPTERLTAAAQRMAQGELTAPISIEAQDEIGRLAESLETMRQKLRASMEQVEGINRELESRVNERTARLGAVLGKVISAQEEERYRLARELHDETAQALGALCITLDRIRDGLPQAPSAETLERVAEAKNVAAHLLDDMRRLILDLRPTALDDFGLIPAIRWYTESRLEEHGVNVTLVAPPPAGRLPGPIEVALFRIVQEAINNIAKHAKAHNATISIEFTDSAVGVTITDDGQGFDVANALSPGAAAKSVGLLGMQERVSLLGGRMEIRSQPGQGTRVHVEVPIS